MDLLRLRQLAEAELLYQRGLPPHATYIFKHALIQDTAYQSLLKSTRQQYHQRIARVLEDQPPETVEVQPELLAHHYTAAGLVVQAIPYWQQAGERASLRSAYVEAVAHFTRGLELLKTLADTPERTQQELTLQTALGTTLSVTKGYAAPEVKQAYTRALELCRQLGETPQLFPVLIGLWRFYFLRVELQTARELAEQELRLAQSIQDPALLVWPHSALGLTLCHLGELPSALTYLEQSIGLYDPQTHSPDRSQAGQDPKVTCLSYAARILWHLGYPNQARKKIDEALTLAQELSHPFSLAFPLSFAATLHQLLGEIQGMQERAEVLVTLSREQGFPYWLAWGTIFQGSVLAERGQGQEGIARLDQGLSTMRATGAELNRSYGLAWLAKAYGKEGQIEEGLTVLAEGLAIAYKTNDRHYEAELHRLKGELLLAQTGHRLQAIGHREKTEEVEACFLQAIDIARRQEAKSLELRAATSLSRLWQQQGKTAEARDLLGSVYNWFTEGFETQDLQDARALLHSLDREEKYY